MDYYNSKQRGGTGDDGTSGRQWPLICLPPTTENRRIFFMIAEYKELLDSSNCTVDNWILISKHIKYFYDKFDGFIILHGTDTLAYGASFLSFILEGLCKPVIVTGSQIPIGELRSDGRENFLASLLIAGGEKIIPEVTVFFDNKVSVWSGSIVIWGICEMLLKLVSCILIHIFLGYHCCLRSPKRDAAVCSLIADILDECKFSDWQYRHKSQVKA